MSMIEAEVLVAPGLQDQSIAATGLSRTICGTDARVLMSEYPTSATTADHGRRSEDQGRRQREALNDLGVTYELFANQCDEALKVAIKP
ncbi:hypothetical protein LJY18_02850 [Pseudomonas sp. MMS21-TM103]|uniref:hypothetical protein n=1 Tax=Pseudomonas sp. MMS21 TM103 TaxID=2886506 RepID=UPI001EDFBC83|nr:hypothetical protein [Pseudomonas sp. MMS21 TM103]MCG4452240.1 hypothetical protein [Pseudomonas sp. MMS21 TM103]